MLAREHRVATSALADIVFRRVVRASDALEGRPVWVVREGLLDEAVPLVSEFSDGAAALSMDFYESSREAAGVPGRFTPPPAPVPPVEQTEGTIRYMVGFLAGEAASSHGDVSRMVAGSLARSVLDVGDETVVAATRADEAARGWSRVLEPGACDFCRMLSDRGGVYTGESVRFASHDNCRCSAVPHFSWGEGDRRVSTVPFQASQRRMNERTRELNRRRVKEFIAANYGD